VLFFVEENEIEIHLPACSGRRTDLEIEAISALKSDGKKEVNEVFFAPKGEPVLTTKRSKIRSPNSKMKCCKRSINRSPVRAPSWLADARIQVVTALHHLVCLFGRSAPAERGKVMRLLFLHSALVGAALIWLSRYCGTAELRSGAKVVEAGSGSVICRG